MISRRPLLIFTKTAGSSWLSKYVSRSTGDSQEIVGSGSLITSADHHLPQIPALQREVQDLDLRKSRRRLCCASNTGSCEMSCVCMVCSAWNTVWIGTDDNQIAVLRYLVLRVDDVLDRKRNFRIHVAAFAHPFVAVHFG